MKEKYIHFGLLAVAALLVLWYLFRKSAPAAAVVTSAGEAAAPSYPAAPSITLGDVVINSGVPAYLNHNEPAAQQYGFQVNSEVGHGPNSACDCGEAGRPVAFPMVSADLFQSSVDNFKSFLNKGAAPSAAPATAQPVAARPAPAPARPAQPPAHREVA
jgi:hypothetical protein